MSLINLKIVPAIIYLIAGICFSQNSPSKSKVSENLFSNYGRLGIYGGIHILNWQNTPNASIDYKVNSGLTPSIGIDFNFYQTSNFNFRAGFFIRNHSVKTKTFIAAMDLPDGFPFITNSTDRPYWNYHLPLTAEYNIGVAKNLTLSLNTGVELMLYSITPRFPEFVEFGYRNGDDMIITNEYENFNSLTGGINLGAGFYYEWGNTLVRFDAKFHFHLGENIITRDIKVRNLLLSPDANSTHSWNGDYISFNITLHPKNWFPRNSK
jgi:hypothetical protein